METNKILGIIIIIALILSVITVGYSAINKTAHPNEKVANTVYIMDQSDLNKTELENTENGTIKTINLEIKQKTGGVNIKFADNTTTIYNISSNDKNQSTTVNTQQDGDHLDITVESNSSDNTIVLSNKYNYNITGSLVAGGFSALLNNGAKVDVIDVDTTAGGVNVEFNTGSLNTLDVSITTGGLNIKGEPNGVTTVNSQIEVGGLNIQSNKNIVDLFSKIEVGGVNPGNYQQISDNEYKGNEFDSSENKLIIHNYIKLGGVNTQKIR